LTKWLNTVTVTQYAIVKKRDNGIIVLWCEEHLLFSHYSTMFYTSLVSLFFHYLFEFYEIKMLKIVSTSCDMWHVFVQQNHFKKYSLTQSSETSHRSNLHMVSWEQLSDQNLRIASANATKNHKLSASNFSLWHKCIIKQTDHKNLENDHLRWTVWMFKQFLPTRTIRNVGRLEGEFVSWHWPLEC